MKKIIKPISFAAQTPYLVPDDGSFSREQFATQEKDIPNKKSCKRELKEIVKELRELQHILYADNRYSVLLVFQAMDAAGKDGTIRHVLSGINPAGCEVHSFKQPSNLEREHDFLWRTNNRLPQRGHIGIFNRSYYEEVLVVKVHPEYLQSQNIPPPKNIDELWQTRYESICAHEKHLANNGTVILKFWLNVSFEEQTKRLMARLNEPEKHWKFSASDLEERKYWPDYMHAYEQALKHTSTTWAPWYAIPADNKPYMRLQVAKTLLSTLKNLNLSFPQVKQSTLDHFADYKKTLQKDL